MPFDTPWLLPHNNSVAQQTPASKSVQRDLTMFTPLLNMAPTLATGPPSRYLFAYRTRAGDTQHVPSTPDTVRYTCGARLHFRPHVARELDDIG